MPSKRAKKTHSDYLKEVCFFCPSKAPRRLTKAQKDYIAKYEFPDYYAFQEVFEGGVCENHSRTLNDLIKSGEKSTRKLPNLDYNAILDQLQKIPKVTRSNPVCLCFICKIAKVDCILPKKKPQKIEKKKCKNCYSTLEPEKRHDCNRTTRVNNLMQDVTPKTRMKLALETIKEEQKKKESKSPLQVSRLSGGPSMPIYVGSNSDSKSKESSSKISLETMKDMQNRTDVSDNSLLNIAAAFRANNVEIEAGLTREIYDSGKICADHFEIQEMDFDVKVGDEQKIQSKSVVICKDVEQFVEFVKQKRNVKNSATLKYGLDAGGDFFKICLNIVEEKEMKLLKKSGRKKAKYQDSSVKKLLILAIVKGVPETYENVEKVMVGLKLEHVKFDFCLATDLKLQNIMIGIQSGSSTYPCSYCESARPFDKTGDLRSFGRIKKEFEKFQDSGGLKKDAKFYFNCIHLPLISVEDDDTLILELFPIPELHLHIGIVNKVFNELNESWGSDQGFKWLADNNIHKNDYRDRQMNGNECKKLLQKLSKLKKEIPRKLWIYIGVLQAFKNKVRISCFGQDLKPGFKKDIANFEKAYQKLNIPMTNKVHILVAHVADFCDRKGRGLGFFSEQASEAVHADFKKTWKNYKVAEENPAFGKRLLSATLKYNSKHL